MCANDMLGHWVLIEIIIILSICDIVVGSHINRTVFLALQGHHESHVRVRVMQILNI